MSYQRERNKMSSKSPSKPTISGERNDDDDDALVHGQNKKYVRISSPKFEAEDLKPEAK